MAYEMGETFYWLNNSCIFVSGQRSGLYCLTVLLYVILNSLIFIHVLQIDSSEVGHLLCTVGSVGNTVMCLLGLRSVCKNYTAQIHCPALRWALCGVGLNAGGICISNSLDRLFMQMCKSGSR